MRRRLEGSADAGFTLVELLMVIAMTGLITSAIASALSVGLRSTDEAAQRLAESVDTQLLSAYFPQDVQSAGPGAADVSTAVGATAGCGGGGSNVLALRSVDPSGAARGVSYRLVTVAGESQLVRYACGGASGSTELVVARSLRGGGAVADTSALPRISLRLTAVSGYTGTVSAVRRTTGTTTSLPPGPAPTCTAESFDLTPDTGTLLVGGVLLTPPTLSVVTSGPCGPLSARYTPDGATPQTVTLTGSGATRTGVLAGSGWIAAVHEIAVLEGTTELGRPLWTVSAAAPCTVTGLVSDPGSGERSSNPAPAVLTAGAVRISLSASATCGALRLVYDPLSTTSNPTARQLDFPSTGPTRLVEIPATTTWSDGPHALVIRDAVGTEVARTSLTVRPPPACSVVSLVLSEREVNATGNGSLNKDVDVTVQTAGACTAVQVRYAPGSTEVTRDLSGSGTTWTLRLRADEPGWTRGTKTFRVLLGGAASGPSATLEVR